MDNIKVYTVEHLSTLGVVESPAEVVDINIEVMSEELYTEIVTKTGVDQLDLAKEMQSRGWSMDDFEICLKLLRRKNKIAYFV